MRSFKEFLHETTDLLETLDSTLKLEWQINSGYDMTIFNWGEQPYIIQVAPKANHYGVLSREVSFFRANEDNHVLAHHKPKNPSSEVPIKIYGVVLNALIDRFKDADTALYLTAEAEHSNTKAEYESSIQLYTRLCKIVCKRTGMFLYHADGKPNVLLLSKIQINSSKWIDEDRNRIKECLERFVVVPRI